MVTLPNLFGDRRLLNCQKTQVTRIWLPRMPKPQPRYNRREVPYAQSGFVRGPWNRDR
jgi:hypothetical protein